MVVKCKEPTHTDTDAKALTEQCEISSDGCMGCDAEMIGVGWWWEAHSGDPYVCVCDILISPS